MSDGPVPRHCVSCGQRSTKTLAMSLRCSDTSEPSILLAYGMCDECDMERCGEMALSVLRDAVKTEPCAS
jgi:hypothetical protein